MTDGVLPTLDTDPIGLNDQGAAIETGLAFGEAVPDVEVGAK